MTQSVFITANAIVFTCIEYQRRECLEEFYYSLESMPCAVINIDAYILLKAILGIPFTSSDIIYCRKGFEYENNRYMDKCQSLFVETLQKNMMNQIHSYEIPLSGLYEKKFLAPFSDSDNYANLSLKQRPKVYMLRYIDNSVGDLSLQVFCGALLIETHEEVKQLMRKNHI